MTWHKRDDKRKKKTDSSFLSCTERWERDYVERRIRAELPYASEVVIKKAILNCCDSIPAPRPRKDFMKCVYA